VVRRQHELLLLLLLLLLVLTKLRSDEELNPKALALTAAASPKGTMPWPHDFAEQKRSVPVPPEMCEMPCKGNAQDKCGGFWFVAVIKVHCGSWGEPVLLLLLPALAIYVGGGMALSKSADVRKHRHFKLWKQGKGLVQDGIAFAAEKATGKKRRRGYDTVASVNFAVGEQVQYFSSSKKTWVAAKVKRVDKKKGTVDRESMLLLLQLLLLLLLVLTSASLLPCSRRQEGRQSGRRARGGGDLQDGRPGEQEGGEEAEGAAGEVGEAEEEAEGGA